MKSRKGGSFLGKAPGPEHVREFFRRARARERLSHAYLFTGPADSGKRRFARSLAKALFCPTGEPCGQCPSCRAADSGNHAAIHIFSSQDQRASMDIGEVRRLSIQDRHRRAGLSVSIIEDVERLSLPATNALLKTLEEPSRGTLLLLTAPSTGSLLPTIVSRCHRILFPGRYGTALDDGAPSGPGSGIEQSPMKALFQPHFFAENDLREWLTSWFPEASGSRESLTRLLDRLISRVRSRWVTGEQADLPHREDPLPLLEDLVSLRGDVDSNVNVDLVLEALIRALRRRSASLMS